VYFLDYNFSRAEILSEQNLAYTADLSRSLEAAIGKFQASSMRIAENPGHLFPALLSLIEGKTGAILTFPAGYLSDRKALRSAAHDKFEILEMRIDQAGRLDSQFLLDLPCPPALVSIPAADPFTGLMMPIKAVIDFFSSFPDAIIHLDITAAIGNSEIDASALPVDLITLSVPTIESSTQEAKILILPENSRLATAISDIGRPFSLPQTASAKPFGREVLIERRRLQTAFEAALLSRIEDAKILFANALRLVNTSAVSIYGINSESLTAILDSRGVRARALSLCAQLPDPPLPVFGASGIPFADTIGAVHFSFGFCVTEADLSAAAAIIADSAIDLRKIGIC
jgi:cysteine desulfurase